jgi:hypothetical protein
LPQPPPGIGATSTFYQFEAHDPFVEIVRRLHVLRGECEVMVSHDQFSSVSTMFMTSALSPVGGGYFDHPFIHIVIFKAQRPAHHRMHHVSAGDVGEFEDFLVAEMLLQRFENAVGHAPAIQHQRVCVGQQGPLCFIIAISDLPVRNGLDLFLGEAGIAGGLAVLRKDKLAANGIACPDLPELAMFRAQLAVWRSIEAEAFCRMLEGVRYDVEHGPPVSGCSGGSAGLCERVAVFEQKVEETVGIRVAGLAPGLFQPGHSISSCCSVVPQSLFSLCAGAQRASVTPRHLACRRGG